MTEDDQVGYLIADPADVQLTDQAGRLLADALYRAPTDGWEMILYSRSGFPDLPYGGLSFGSAIYVATDEPIDEMIGYLLRSWSSVVPPLQRLYARGLPAEISPPYSLLQVRRTGVERGYADGYEAYTADIVVTLYAATGQEIDDAVFALTELLADLHTVTDGWWRITQHLPETEEHTYDPVGLFSVVIGGTIEYERDR